MPLTTPTKELLTEVEMQLSPLERWSHDCHNASIFIVRAKIFPTARVARGWCEGIGSQHSWVVLGDDCYDQDATIIDPTLWSYDEDVTGVWTGVLGRHIPHGAGSIWEYGKPISGGDKPIKLKPKRPFSDEAKRFLLMLGPLDREGWARLAHAPVEDWPAAEILPAINETVGPLVPIDIIGMLTDENPGGVYL